MLGAKRQLSPSGKAMDTGIYRLWAAQLHLLQVWVCHGSDVASLYSQDVNGSAENSIIPLPFLLPSSSSLVSPSPFLPQSFPSPLLPSLFCPPLSPYLPVQTLQQGTEEGSLPAHTNPAGAPGPTPSTHISGSSTFHQGQRALGHETVTPREQRGPEGATREWRKVSFSGMKTPPWNIQFLQWLCVIPTPQNSRDNLWMTQKPKGPDLVPTQAAPCAQESSKWRGMETEKSQGKCAGRCLNPPP